MGVKERNPAHADLGSIFRGSVRFRYHESDAAAPRPRLALFPV
jgi:hypothetical protein